MNADYLFLKTDYLFKKNTQACSHKLSKYNFYLINRKVVTCVRYMCPFGNWAIILNQRQVQILTSALGKLFKIF